MKVAIGVPSIDLVHMDFFVSLMNLLIFTKGLDIKVINERGCYIDASRTEIVRKAREYGADYLLFLDSDMAFPADTLNRLLAANKDVVGCNYPKRRPPFSCTASGMDGQALKPGLSGIDQVRVIPTGILLIKMSVLDALEYPEFLCEWSHKGGKPTQYGEDVLFCLRVQKAGIPLFCEHNLSKEIAHLGTTGFTLDLITEEAPCV